MILEVDVFMLRKKREQATGSRLLRKQARCAVSLFIPRRNLGARGERQRKEDY
jgi:hypothetical protein